MRLALGSLIALALAAAIGLGLTWLALERNVAFGAVTLGAWTAWPRQGTTDIDPYARARIARSGQIPVGSGDGIAFVATADDNGRALDASCDVLVSGVTPTARFWTLTLSAPDGALLRNPLDRHGFTSQEITRRADGSFEIVVASRARAGNWLPSGEAGRYVLMLRLYDSPVGVATRAVREAPMPAVATRDCR